MPKLFPHLPFLDDETPVSWAGRLAALHGCPSLRAFLTDMGIRPSELLHGVRAKVERLCDVAGQDPFPVLRNTAVSTGRETFLLRNQLIPASMLVREETRFCPLCLHEDSRPGIARRDRLAWNLRVMTTCPKHRLALIYRGREHRENMLHKLVSHVPERGDDLLALADETPRRMPSPLQSYVLARLDGHKGPQWLDGQTLEQAVKATQMLGVVMAFGMDITLGSVDRDGWDLAGRMGWDWTEKGEPGLLAAFEKLQAGAFDRGRGGQNYFTVFGQLYRWQLEPGERADHGPIKDLLRTYIVENMDVCVGRNLFGKVIERRFKYSVQSLALDVGLHRQTLCKVLVDRGLINAANADKPNSILLVDADEGRKVAEMLRGSLQQRHLMVTMNATLPVITNLIALDLLTPLHRKSGQGTRAKCGFDQCQVAEVLDRLHRLAPEMPDLPADWATLTQCTKRARISMRALLELIFSGRVERIGRVQSDSGFSALRVDLDEIRQAYS
ncbi:TniQ family protein [Paracoccus sp. (in: a-proteobacteria)]|uniref:TniQ family protein n=1 Tax=Paracoccus sp. TaxID=267 RepID=UPI0035B1D6D1